MQVKGHLVQKLLSAHIHRCTAHRIMKVDTIPLDWRNLHASLVGWTYGEAASGIRLQVLSMTCVSTPDTWHVLSGAGVRWPTVFAFHTLSVPLCNKTTVPTSSSSSVKFLRVIENTARTTVREKKESPDDIYVLTAVEEQNSVQALSKDSQSCSKGHIHRQNIPDVGAGNREGPRSNCRQVEWQQVEFVSRYRSQPEPCGHISDTSKLRHQVESSQDNDVRSKLVKTGKKSANFFCWQIRHFLLVIFRPDEKQQLLENISIAEPLQNRQHAQNP